eukprot:509645_1
MVTSIYLCLEIITEQITNDIFAILGEGNYSSQQQKICNKLNYLYLLKNSAENIDEFVIDENFMIVIFDFVENSLLTTIKHQIDKNRDILNSERMEHLYVNHVLSRGNLWHVYSLLFKDITELMSIMHSEFGESEFHEQLHQFDSSYSQTSEIRELIFIAKTIYEWKVNGNNNQKDISIFSYRRMNTLNVLINDINIELNKTMSIARYYTDNYPNIIKDDQRKKEEQKNTSTKKRLIKIYAVNMEWIPLFETELLSIYVGDIIVLMNRHPNVSISYSSYWFQMDFIFQQMWHFLLGLAENEHYCIKQWLEDNKNVFCYGIYEDIQLLMTKIFTALKLKYTDNNMTKNQNQMLKIMEATYTNKITFNFKIMRTDMILDPMVVDLIISFVNISFGFILEDNSNFMELLLTDSDFARTGNIWDSEKWLYCLHKHRRIFYIALDDVALKVRKTLVLNTTTMAKITPAIKVFKMISDIFHNFIDEFKIASIVSKEIQKDKESEDVEQDVSIVTRSFHRNNNLQELLARIDGNAEIKRYKVMLKNGNNTMFTLFPSFIIRDVID